MSVVTVDKIINSLGGGASFPLSLSGTTAAAQTDGLTLATSAVATVGAQKWSPALRFTASGWATTPVAAQAVDWAIDVEPTQGSANADGVLTFKGSLNGGAFTTLLQISRLSGRVDTGGVATFSSSSANMAAGNYTAQINASTLYSVSGFTYSWGSSASAALTADTGLSRISAGVVGLGNGTAADVSGQLNLKAVKLVPSTVALLPAAPADGTRAFVTDANAATFGTAVVGGGANIVPVFYAGGWKIG